MFVETNRSNSPDERRAALALSLVADVGSVAHIQLIERFGYASRALDEGFPRERVREAYAEADELLLRGTKAGLALIAQADAEYPHLLRHSHAPPAVLWSLGDWSVIRPPVVAIVGTRRATSYGLRMTREIGGALARAGACIVSGMAFGIDAAAHRVALDEGGKTVAVLASGADVPSPRSHRLLHREIAQRGLVISEFEPGADAFKGAFPRRNRIIAGMAQLTIVVEAPRRSGALKTSEYAMEFGRDVAIVPGPLDSPQSEGSNALTRDGAHLITSIEDALTLVQLDAPAPPARPTLNGEHELRIWKALAERSAVSLDELCARTQLPVAECLTTVTALEIRGLIECALTGEIRKR